jgi:excisionase family DNA binding protein
MLAPLASPATVENPAGQPTVLTVDELASLLRVDRKTAYAAVTRGEVPGVRRLGRTIRVHREAVMAWLRDGQAPRTRGRGDR